MASTGIQNGGVVGEVSEWVKVMLVKPAAAGPFAGARPAGLVVEFRDR